MKKILIVDDEEVIRMLYGEELEEEGYEVATASNGRIGIQLYQSEPFDIVITDLIMPDMEGIETMMRLRKLDPGVKVIAISGGGRNRPDEYLHLAAKLGALSTFKKPVDRTALLFAAHALVS